jgi:hypothetical protein
MIHSKDIARVLEFLADLSQDDRDVLVSKPSSSDRKKYQHWVRVCNRVGVDTTPAGDAKNDYYQRCYYLERRVKDLEERIALAARVERDRVSKSAKSIFPRMRYPDDHWTIFQAVLLKCFERIPAEWQLRIKKEFNLFRKRSGYINELYSIFRTVKK